MKKLIISALAASGVLLMGACAPPQQLPPPSGIAAGCYNSPSTPPGGPDYSYLHNGFTMSNNTIGFTGLNCLTVPFNKYTFIAAPSQAVANGTCLAINALYTTPALNLASIAGLAIPAGSWECLPNLGP